MVQLWPMGVCSTATESFRHELSVCGSLLAVCYDRMFQAHLLYFSSQPRFRQFHGKQYFKTTILALGTLDLIGPNIFIWAFSEDRAKTEVGGGRSGGRGRARGVFCLVLFACFFKMAYTFILILPFQMNFNRDSPYLSHISSVFSSFYTKNLYLADARRT